MNKSELMTKLGVSEAELNERLENQHTKNKMKGDKSRSLKEKGVSFEELSKRTPEVGAELIPEEGKEVTVFEDWKNRDGEPFLNLFCYAKIDFEATGWYLHSGKFGLVCLITIRSQRCLEKTDQGYKVQRLRVVRKSNSGKALICEALQ